MRSRFENSMRFFQETEGIKPEIYYHYTTISALYSIISTQSFWLLNLKSSNDKRELTYTFRQFKNDFDKIIQYETDQNRKALLIKAADSCLEGKLTRDAMKPNKDSYGLCLCRKKDNLTHWDRYTNNCAGVSIGVNIRALDVLCSRMNTYFGYHIIESNCIAYSENDRVQLIKKSIEGIIERLHYLKEDSDSSAFLPAILPVAYTNMKSFVKANSFSDEDEVRLYFNPKSILTARKIMNDVFPKLSEGNVMCNNIRKNYEKMISDMEIEEVKFYLFRTGIRSYHKMCLKEIWGNGLIPEIMLGPMCTQDKKELRAFLDVNGLRGTTITESKVPIR